MENNTSGTGSVTIEELSRLYKTIHTTVIIDAIVIIAAAVLCIRFVNPALVLLFAALAFRLFGITGMRRKYRRLCDEYRLMHTVGQRIHATSYMRKGGAGIDETTVKNADLIPVSYKPLFLNGIAGRTDDMDISMCESTFTFRYEDQISGKTKGDYLSGVWIHLVRMHEKDNDWRVITPDLEARDYVLTFYNKKKDFVRRETENGLIYYTAAENSAPSEETLRRIATLTNKSSRLLAVSAKGRNVDIFMHSRFLSEQASLTVEPTENNVGRDIFPELAQVLSIAASV